MVFVMTDASRREPKGVRAQRAPHHPRKITCILRFLYLFNGGIDWFVTDDFATSKVLFRIVLGEKLRQPLLAT